MASSDKQRLAIPSAVSETGEVVSSQSPQQDAKLLKAREDKFGGVIIDPESLPLAVLDFVSSLNASLSEWRHQGKKGVWLQLPSERAELVSVAIEAGFWYHHAERKYVMLAYWIPDGPCTLPPNASHQVGIGAFVVNDKREVLAVKEKNGPYRGSGLWKMPTGLVHQGENIFAGAMREVKEETGIDTQFLEVVGFRHSLTALFGKSDLFLVCMLQPISSEIVIQDSEIEAAQWMPVEEFVAQPKYQQNEMLNKMLAFCVASVEKRYNGFSAVLISNSNRPPVALYYNVHDMTRVHALDD